MQTGYVGVRTTYFYEDKDSEKRHYTLIYGEKVDYIPAAAGDSRIYAENRTRKGYLKKQDLLKAPVLEVYYIDVGQGDSTFIVTPKGTKILIDGGVNNQALKFLSWKYKLQDYSPGQSLKIDYVIVSHADGDHINGLKLMVQNPLFDVGTILHNGIARFLPGKYETTLGARSSDKDYLVTKHNKIGELKDSELKKDFLEWKQAIEAKRVINYRVVKLHEVIKIENDLDLEILGPRLGNDSEGKGPYLPWFTDEGKTINGNSVIVKMTYDEVSFIFPGDINEKASKYVLKDNKVAAKLSSHVLKAPHHGSHDYHGPFLEKVNPQITVVSSGEENTHGHPRGNFLGCVGKAAREYSLIFATQISGKFKDTDANLRDKLDLDEKEWKELDGASRKKLREQFKRRLHGMINVRTDGKKLYVARRIKTAHGWEDYGAIKPSPDSP